MKTNLDQKIKNASDNIPIEYNHEAWKKLEAQLNNSAIAPNGFLCMGRFKGFSLNTIAFLFISATITMLLSNDHGGHHQNTVVNKANLHKEKEKTSALGTTEKRIDPTYPSLVRKNGWSDAKNITGLESKNSVDTSKIKFQDEILKSDTIVNIDSFDSLYLVW